MTQVLWLYSSLIVAMFASGAATAADQENLPLIERLKASGIAQKTAKTDSPPPGFVAVQGLGDDASLFVETRTDKMTIKDCSGCHASETGRSLPADPTERRAHWHVELRHANADVMTCATCHGKGPEKSPTLFSGTAVDFDHSYQVCGQCHFSELNDWRHGAHGKRLLGWRGPRTVRACAGCHNPHAPQWAKRWPKTNTTIPSRKQGGNP